MRKTGLTPVYQKPNTSKPRPEHKICPYLLRGVKTTELGHVRCTDTGYPPMRPKREARRGIWILDGVLQPEAVPHSSLDGGTPDGAYWVLPWQD